MQLKLMALGRVPFSRSSVVKDEIGDGDAAGNFKPPVSDEQKKILSIGLPAAGLAGCNFTNAERMPPAGVGELAVPGITLFLQ